MKILKLVCLGIMAGVVFAGTTHVPGAYAQEVQGPKVAWKFNVWGKRRAFTEGIETISKIVSEKTGEISRSASSTASNWAGKRRTWTT